jgi:5S rRNA maturation endonuclease (ribonuclease M5)
MDVIGIVEVCQVFDLNYSRVYNPGRRGPHIQISCPLAWAGQFHTGKDEKPSCSVTVNDQGPSLSRCHGASCGYRGSFLDLIRKAVQLRRTGRANKELAGLIKKIKEAESVDLGNLLDKNKKRAHGAPTTLYAAKSMRTGRTIPEDRLSRMDETYHAYAESRGVSVESWKRWGLLFDPRKQCVVFPVRGFNQGLVGMTGRGVDPEDRNPKKNYPGLDKGNNLFGQHLLKPDQPIVIVEGPIDCVHSDVSLSPLGVGVVATLGEGFSRVQAKIVRGFKPPAVYVFTDGDRGGETIAYKINNVLKKHVILKRMDTPRGEDPGSLSNEQIVSLFNAAGKIKT